MLFYVFLGVNLEEIVGPAGIEPATWRITALFLLGIKMDCLKIESCQMFDDLSSRSVSPTNGLKRPLLIDRSTERNVS